MKFWPFLIAIVCAQLELSCARGWYGAPTEAAKLGKRRVCLDVPGNKRADLLPAIAAWNHALNGKMTLVEDPEACDLYVVEMVHPPCDPSAVACADKIGGSVIYLYPGRYEKHASEVMAHEIGHTLGAQHVEGTLMAPTVSNWECPDVTTMAQVSAYQHWNLTELRWCAL